MPSVRHEGLLLPFQHRPQLAAELLGDILRAQHAAPPRLLDPDSANIVDANLSQIVPTEYRADLVVMHRSQDMGFAIVVEVQLRRDDTKRYRWPAYAAVLRDKHRCHAFVLVVTPSAEVARWAAQPIWLGPTEDAIFRPIVCGPSAIPCVTDVEVAKHHPELAVLSAQAHGQGPNGLAVGKAAIAAARLLDDSHRRVYTDLVIATASELVRRQLEEHMFDFEYEHNGQKMRYEYQSDFARKYYGQGRADGTAEGEAAGRAHALMVLLDARHVVLTAEQRERIIACRDLHVLDGWITRAVIATSVEDILR